MTDIAPAKVSRWLVNGYLEGQRFWPVSTGGAARLGHRVMSLLTAGYPFPDLVAIRPDSNDYGYAVEVTMQRHIDVGRRTTGARVDIPREVVEERMPESFLINWCAALAGVVGAATGRRMANIRLLAPGDPDFKATAAALGSGVTLANVERLLGIADKATTTGHGSTVAQRYQNALTPGIVSREFPAEVIAGGYDAIREAAIGGPKSQVGKLIIGALIHAGETSRPANAMARNLVAAPDPSLLAGWPQ